MGFIRGSLLFIIGILLLFSLMAGNLFLILTLSITPENIQKQVVSNFDNIAGSFGNGINITEEIDKNFDMIKLYCLNNSDFVFSQNGYTIDIPCDVALQGKEAIVEKGTKDIIDEAYYKDYSCEGLLKCIINSENPMFLVSKQAKDYWRDKFYYLLIISLILITIMFFLVEQKSGLFIGVGSLLVISSLPFMMIKGILSFFNSSFLQFIPILFSEAYRVFLMSFIVGFIILGLGLGLKFLNFGNFIAEKFNKEEDLEKKNSKIKNQEKEI